MILRSILILFLIVHLLCSRECNVVATPSDTSALTTVELKSEDNEDGNDVETVDGANGEEADVFLPTHEWQTIKPGQGIPRGLHVRLNLETGEKEAKLLEDQPKFENPDDQMFSKEIVKELKLALRLIPDEVPQQDESDVTGKKFRSIDEIKEDLERLKINMTTENEIILELLEKYVQKGTTESEKVDILTELEYYVHQYDNAVDFVKMGGLTLTYSALNSSDTKIRTAAAFLLGSAMQSNPKVQVAAIEIGVMQQLVHLLATDTCTSLQLKALYALSSMLRQFPYAQKKFLEHGGLSILTGFFSKKEADVLKLQLKAVTLIHDLVLENKYATTNSSSIDDPSEREKFKQYTEIKMKEAVENHGWCRHISQLLTNTDHDVREKVLTAMSVIVDVCNKEFSRFVRQLQVLRQEYERLASDENELPYFTEILNVIKDILMHLEAEFLKIHNEL